jgi:hypothetical protein
MFCETSVTGYFFCLLSIPTPYSIITRNDAIKLIIVKLFSVSQNAHWDTEIEKKVLLNKLVLNETDNPI